MADPVDTMTKIELAAEPAAETPPNQMPGTTEQQPPDQGASMGTRSIKRAPIRAIVMAVVVIGLAGTGTGYALAQLAPGAPTSEVVSPDNTVIPDSAEAVRVDTIYGADDTATFPDDVTGILVKGGIEGEGSHHLVRPGGKDQYVYLTSSVVDLDLFVGTEVEVWGETFEAQTAGWLLDVGRVKVLKLDAAGEAEIPNADALPEE